MKRFEFSLDRLLKMKRQHERMAELEQIRAVQAVDAAEARVVALQEQLREMAERINARLGQACSPGQWVSAYEMSERLGQAIAVAEKEVAVAEERLATAKQERMQVATEVEALSSLRSRQHDQWRHDAAAADQDKLDEIGLRNWMTAQHEVG